MSPSEKVNFSEKSDLTWFKITQLQKYLIYVLEYIFGYFSIILWHSWPFKSKILFKIFLTENFQNTR